MPDEDREKDIPQQKTSHQVDALGHIAGQIAHEINNRLTVVLGNLSLIAYTFDGSDDPEMKSSIDDTLDAAQRIRESVRHLQGMTAGFAPKKEVLNVAELLEKVINLWDGDVTPTLSLPQDPLPLVEADPRQIAQAMHNLFANAVEAREEATITITANVATFGAEAPMGSGDAVEIRVSDNAGGVNPDDAEAIFDPYVTTKPGSLGVGLTVAAAIARRHRGQLLFEPLENGSSFRLLLPAYQQ